jgi:hypothetical protein
MPDTVVVETYLAAGSGYRPSFVAVNDTLAGAKPIWINEAGFATTPGRSEREQANWWARAVATFLADPDVEHIGVYEINDLAPGSDVIGDAANYHLGLTRADRTKKLAFATVDLLTDLLDVGTLTVADPELDVRVTRGAAGDLHAHLFRRPDGVQVLFVYDRCVRSHGHGHPRHTGAVGPALRARRAESAHAAFDGRTLAGLDLEPGEVLILRVDP